MTAAHGVRFLPRDGQYPCLEPGTGQRNEIDQRAAVIGSNEQYWVSGCSEPSLPEFARGGTIEDAKNYVCYRPAPTHDTNREQGRVEALRLSVEQDLC
jgi:hypothetical protein